MITAICQECNKQFEYELKPGFPRKYCPACSASKKAAYEATQGEAPVDTVKPGQIGIGGDPRIGDPNKANERLQIRKPVKGTAYEKDPVGLAVEVFCSDKDMTMEAAILHVKQAQEAFSE